MAYMLKSGIEFDALKCIFQNKTSSENGSDDNKIIKILNDHDIMKKGLMLKYMGQMWRMSIWMTKCLMVRFQEKTKLVQMMNHLLVLKMDLELKI
ncbi:hypothetical protein Pfo_005181, partial [Paulownia fortunei]